MGDDCLQTRNPFLLQCTRALQQASRRLALHIMAGNRDFLMGEHCMAACGATALQDPCVLAFGGQRWLLTHGDALCTDDLPYQQFRATVRSTEWQTAFLARPLDERLAIARDIRSTSERSKQRQTTYADLDPASCLQWMHTHQTRRMIHGHTHRPAIHELEPGVTRTVLSDWDMDAATPRGDILRLRQDANGALGVERLDAV